MKATSALLALGVCLAMAAPSARADNSNIYVDWKFGNRNNFTFNNGDGYVWNGAFRDAVIAAMEAGDYAAFQALTNGFNELAEIQGKWPRYKTGATCGPVATCSFTNAQDFVTFLYFTGTGNGSKSWDGNNSPTYFIFEKSTEDKRYDPSNTWGFQVNAGEDINSFTSGTVGAARTNGASLLIATDPVKLPRAGFSPAGMTNGLAENTVVTCAVPETIVFDGVHYTATGKADLQTWNGDASAWGDSQTVDAPAENGTNTYTYTHEAASARMTWKYAADGFRPDIGFLPAGYGYVTIGTEPNFTGLENEGYYTNGTPVALTAVPADAGFRFVKWVVNGEDKGPEMTHTVTMDQPRTVRAVFESIPLTWNGGVNNVWTNGGAGWLAADGTPTNWLNGARAVFTNGASVTAEIAAEGVTATSVRFEGAGAVELNGGRLTMINDAAITATNPGVAVAIDAPIAGTDGLTVSANAAEKSFVIGKPATFTGDLAIQAGRVEFGEEGKLGADGTFAGEVTLAKNTVLATPPCKQTFNGKISGQGKVLVLNTANAARAEAIFKGGAAWTGGLTVGTNGFVNANKNSPIPTQGAFEIIDGGKLKIADIEMTSEKAPFSVRNGGILEVAKQTALRGNWGSKGNALSVEGGTILLDTASIFYYMNVTNGGTVTGQPVALWDCWKVPQIVVTVSGSNPLLQQGGYNWGDASLAADKKPRLPLAMTVENIGDDPELDDMIISGPITGDAKGKAMIKAGAGTVVFSGENTYSNCITRIDEGTLRFETDHAMGIGTNTDTRIVLNGDGAEGKICVLDIGTNANKVCALGLEQKGGTLKLGEGGTIEFAASDALGWAEGAELTIKGAFGPRTVRFGTDKNGLTQEQLKKIKLADWLGISLHLDADGWLNPPGTVISIIR